MDRFGFRRHSPAPPSDAAALARARAKLRQMEERIERLRNVEAVIQVRRRPGR